MKPLHDEVTTLNLLAEVQSQLLDFEPKIKESKIIHGQARYLSWDFSKLPFDTLEVLQITDVQFGHKQCLVKKLKEYLNWVLVEPNRYIVFGGDMVDAGHVQSKGSPFEQVGDPQEELWQFCKLAAPLRHRVLGYVGGNHERRSIPTFGDLGRSIATILKLPYSPGKQFIDITFGKHKPFKMSMHHGFGSAQTIGSIANGTAKFMSQGDSQYYLLGHLHQAIAIQTSREYRDGKGDMRLTKIIGARGSSFLDSYGTYGEVNCYSAQSVQMPLLVLNKNGTWSVSLK